MREKRPCAGLTDRPVCEETAPACPRADSEVLRWIKKSQTYVPVPLLLPYLRLPGKGAWGEALPHDDTAQPGLGQASGLGSVQSQLPV